MPSLAHTLLNSRYCHLRRRQAQKKQLYLVSLALPLRYQPGITSPTQRRFKSETFSLFCMLINLIEHQPPCANGHAARLKGTQSFGNQVSIDENRAIRLVWQIFPGKSRFTCAVWPRNYEYFFSLHAGKSTLSAPTMKPSSSGRFARQPGFFQVYQQQGNGGRRDAGNSRRLSERLRLYCLQLLADFRRQAAHALVIKIIRQ